MVVNCRISGSRFQLPVGSVRITGSIVNRYSVLTRPSLPELRSEGNCVFARTPQFSRRWIRAPASNPASERASSVARRRPTKGARPSGRFNVHSACASRISKSTRTLKRRKRRAPEEFSPAATKLKDSTAERAERRRVWQTNQPSPVSVLHLLGLRVSPRPLRLCVQTASFFHPQSQHAELESAAPSVLSFANPRHAVMLRLKFQTGSRVGSEHSQTPRVCMAWRTSVAT